jgi:hypothetical protein
MTACLGNCVGQEWDRGVKRPSGPTPRVDVPLRFGSWDVIAVERFITASAF